MVAFQRLTLFRNLVNLFGPHKRFWILVIQSNVFFYLGNEVRHTVKYSATNPLSSDLCKPSLDEVQPRATGRDKVKMKPFVLAQPRLDIRMLMGPVVVHNQMEVHSRRGLAINLAQELQELYIAMTRVTTPYHGSN